MEGLPSHGPGGQANQAEEAAKQAQEEAMRHDLMATVLEPAARERRTMVILNA
jgi:programmed cell death protein 5